MATEEKKLIQWDNKMGPATVATITFGVINIGVIIGAFMLSAGAFREGVENSKAAVTELKNIVETMRAASSATNERITRVEERTDAVAKSLDRIERKVDNLAGAKK